MKTKLVLHRRQHEHRVLDPHFTFSYLIIEVFNVISKLFIICASGLTFKIILILC